MSSAFTVNGSNAQIADKLEELRLSYSERVFVAWPHYWQGAPDGVWNEDYGVVFGCGRSIWHYKNPIPLTEHEKEPCDYGPYYAVDIRPPFRYRKWTGADEWVEGDGSAGDKLQAGISAQNFKFYRALQNFIISSITYQNGNGGFYNPATLTDSWRISNYWSEAPHPFWQQVGGSLWNGSGDFGLRRGTVITNENGDQELKIMRGFCRSGDVLGAWLIEDITACFSLLTCPISIWHGTGLPDSSEEPWGKPYPFTYA